MFCATTPDSHYIVTGRRGNDGHLYVGDIYHAADCDLDAARLVSWIEIVEGHEAEELFDLLGAMDKKTWKAFVKKCNAWANGGMQAAIEKQGPEAMEQVELLVAELAQKRDDGETKH